MARDRMTEEEYAKFLFSDWVPSKKVVMDDPTTEPGTFYAVQHVLRVRETQNGEEIVYYVPAGGSVYRKESNGYSHVSLENADRVEGFTEFARVMKEEHEAFLQGFGSADEMQAAYETAYGPYLS